MLARCQPEFSRSFPAPAGSGYPNGHADQHEYFLYRRRRSAAAPTTPSYDRGQTTTTNVNAATCNSEPFYGGNERNHWRFGLKVTHYKSLKFRRYGILIPTELFVPLGKDTFRNAFYFGRRPDPSRSCVLQVIDILFSIQFYNPRLKAVSSGVWGVP